MWVEIVPETNQMCGLGILKNFQEYAPWGGDSWRNTDWNIKLTQQETGTGFVMAGFTPTDKCKKTYKALAKKWPIVFQSPVRKNKRTGHKFFFVVFYSNGKV